jgi:hypothetical protein
VFWFGGGVVALGNDLRLCRKLAGGESVCKKCLQKAFQKIPDFATSYHEFADALE